MLINSSHAQPIPNELSVSDDKRQLYAVDTYFNETWEDVTTYLPEHLRSLSDIAAIVLKPDAFAGRAALDGLRWIELHGYRILHARRFKFNRFSIRGIWGYQWNIATPARKEVVDELLQAGDSVYLILKKDGSACASRELASSKGSSNPSQRKPGTFRYDISGPNTLLNYIHTADEPADIVREMGVFFDRNERVEILSAITRSEDASLEAHSLIRLIEESYSHVEDLDVARVIRQLAGRLSGGSLAPQRETDGSPGFVFSPEATWSSVATEIQEAKIELSRWDRIILATTLVRMDTPDGEPVINGLSTSPRTEFANFS